MKKTTTRELLNRRLDLINYSRTAGNDKPQELLQTIDSINMQIWRTIPKDQIKSTRYGGANR